jgi:CheY-like chemotaxis protein
VPTEEVIVTTYPPPDSGSSNDSSFDQIDQQTLNATHANDIRRESDWSSTTGETSRRGSDMPLIPKRTVVPKVVDELPPLCAFVVDDDRYVSLLLHYSSLFPKSIPFSDEPVSTWKVLMCSLTRMLMSRMLTRLGHQVTMAENGKIALGMIKDSQEGKPGVPKFDVCFLDK